MRQSRERLEPRISINKLAEYLIASPRRRRKIISDQKNPSPFIVPRYTDAMEAITDCLTSPRLDLARLRRKASTLRESPARSAHERQKHESCAEAIERFVKMASSLELGGLATVRGSARVPHLDIAGVSVSVRPEVLLVSGGAPAGAVKLYLSKTQSLTKSSGAYATAILFDFVRKQFGSGADYQHCLVADIFAGEVYTAPRALKNRKDDIEAACDEIARLWASA